MDQVTKLVNLLKEKTPEGKVLSPEVVVSVLKKKLDPSVIRNVGGDVGLLARVKVLLSPPQQQQQQQQQKKKTAAASTSSDDSDDSSDDSESFDEEDDEEDYDSDQDEDDEDEEEEEDFDDDDDESTDDDHVEKDDDQLKAGSRRQREEVAGAGVPENSAKNSSVAASPEQHAAEILLFLKKCGLAAAVPRKQNGDETSQQYIDGCLKAVFASKELDINDLSKDAVRRFKVRAELEQLRKEGADLTLDKSQRRGKPIFDDNGKVIGITGGQIIKDAGTVSAGLMDDE